MTKLIEKIDNIIIDFEKEINNNILGLVYLEKLKFHLIDNLKQISPQYFKEFRDESITNIYGEKKLKIDLKKCLDSISNIKKTLSNDSLTIVLNGFKSLEIFQNKSNESVIFNLHKNMGIIIQKKLVFNESISKDTIIIDIFSINEKLDIENY